MLILYKSLGNRRTQVLTDSITDSLTVNTPGGRLLRLMLRSGALRSTDSELVQACIKGLTSLFNLHNSRRAEKAGQKTLNKENRALKEINSINPLGIFAALLCSALYFNKLKLTELDSDIKSLESQLAINVLHSHQILFWFYGCSYY